MTDAALPSTADLPAKAAAAEAPLRAATRADLRMVHARLIECITASPYYSDEFKAYETGRLTVGYLEALYDADPWHVAIMQLKGEPAGFMISGPELGTLWLYWSYVFPEKRKSSMALLAMRNFLTHWDHRRFHKVATYTKPGNDAAAAIMDRFGWTLTATLKRHIFGEDYLLYEHDLTKDVPGYDHGAWHGRMAALKRVVRRLLGR
jgi:RimJ/RimL family protein N-acetyltransferase